MIKITILFLSIVLGMISIFILTGNKLNKKSSLINKYLVIIISITTLRYLAHLLNSIYAETSSYKLMLYVDCFTMVTSPCFYLYFEDLVYEKKTQKQKLIHLIFPVFLILIIIASIFIDDKLSLLMGKIFILTGILLILIYTLKAYKILNTFIWNRKSDINAIQTQNGIIKNWSIFLFITILLISASRFFFLIFYYNEIKYNNSFIWIPAIFWCCIYIKLITTPEIVYGYNFYKEKIEESSKKVVLNKLWNIESTNQSIVLPKEIKISEKIISNLSEYIHQIEEASFHSQLFRNQNLSLDDIAAHIKIPSTHLSYIFKYHCNESFPDYKKIIRINDAIKLLENGYLKTNTIESLSAEVGFNTYNTFHVAFKNITGVTTQEYVTRI